MKINKAQKIVNCTPEQYMELLKNGQVEINGEIKTKEEGTLYNTGELELLEWYNKIMEAQHKKYELTHAPFTMVTLSQEYEAIVEKNSKYSAGCSAVGFRAYLKNGDTLPIDEIAHADKGEWYINGERRTTDYTYNGNDTELVSVWIFDVVGKFTVNLSTQPTFTPHEIDIRAFGANPTLHELYYLYTQKITTYKYVLPIKPIGCKTLIVNGDLEYNQVVPDAVYEVISNCRILNNRYVGNSAYTKKISFPNLEEINAQDPILQALNVEEWDFGKLNKITFTNTNHALFYKTKYVVIPETVKTITGILCWTNSDVVLNCNDANYIDPNWYYPKNLPDYIKFTMGDNWKATVDISQAARYWTPEDFRDLFENKLIPIDPNGGTSAARKITVPATIVETLDNEGITDIALDKGWMIDER